MNNNLPKIRKVGQARVGQEIIILCHNRLKFQYRELVHEFKKNESVNNHSTSGMWENWAEIQLLQFTELPVI